MKTIAKIRYDEERMIYFIKSLLSLHKESEWKAETINGSFILRFSGDKRIVQREILRWINVPERRQNIEDLTKEEKCQKKS